MRLFGIKINILPFEKTDFVIFNKTHSNYIKECLTLLPIVNYKLVDVTYESVCLFVLISPKFYKVLLKKRDIKLAYFAAILAFLKPSHIITFIDNNPNFYQLSLIFKSNTHIII